MIKLEIVEAKYDMVFGRKQRFVKGCRYWMRNSKDGSQVLVKSSDNVWVSIKNKRHTKQQDRYRHFIPIWETTNITDFKYAEKVVQLVSPSVKIKGVDY